MEIFKLYRKIQKMQIELIEQYLEYVKSISVYEMRLGGQISNTDLLLNDVLKRVIDLNDEEIEEEQQHVYERILLKRYSQKSLEVNTLFNNIFKSKKFVDVEKSINVFLAHNRELAELQEQMEHVLEQLENKDGSK